MPLPLCSGRMEKGARSWTTGPLQGRQRVQVLCELHDSIGLCHTNVPKCSLERLAGKAHPNIIYEIVSLFKSEQAATEVTLMQVAANLQYELV